MKNETRVNTFDRWIGKLQTEKAAELGVGNSILDIGCGYGEFTPIFLQKFERVVGLDPVSAYIQKAKLANNKIEYIEGFGETFSLDEKFDTINMTNLLEHADDPITLLKNCKKHL